MLWSNIWSDSSDIVIFKIQHRKSKVKAIHLPFIPNQLIHPTIWKFDLANPKFQCQVIVRLHGGSTILSDLHPFCSMSFGPPIPEIWLFEKKMTWKIQVQGYGWVRRSRSHSGPNNLSTHTPFVPYHSSLPFLIFIVLKTFKIQGQGHGWGQSSKSQSGFDFPSTHIPFVPCQSILSFLIYSFYKIWPWKSRSWGSSKF